MEIPLTIKKKMKQKDQHQMLFLNFMTHPLLKPEFSSCLSLAPTTQSFSPIERPKYSGPISRGKSKKSCQNPYAPGEKPDPAEGTNCSHKSAVPGGKVEIRYNRIKTLKSMDQSKGQQRSIDDDEGKDLQAVKHLCTRRRLTGSQVM